MLYEVLRNERIVQRAMPYDVEKTRYILRRFGLNPDLAPLDLHHKVSIATVHLMPVQENRPYIDRFHRYGSNPTREVTDDAVIYTYTKEPKGLSTIKADLIETLDRKHTAYESGYFRYENHLIRMDLQARINIQGVVEGFQSGILTSTQWRCKRIDNMESPDIEQALSGIDTRSLEPTQWPLTSLEAAQMLRTAIIQSVNRGFYAKNQIEQEIKALDETSVREYSVEVRFNELVSV
jgi:hypothetical protein